MTSGDTDDAHAPPLAARIHDAFRALVLDPEFPCVGARSALNQKTYRFAVYDRLGDAASIRALAADLHDFASAPQPPDGQFATFVAAFVGPKVRDEMRFETLLWRTLRDLRRLDTPHHDWDPAVSADPDDPRFSFSFGGRAFFVVGLSPASSRWARTFSWPLLAFNPHQQFEHLRASGHFERMQDVIRERDVAIEGDVNPNLADFGSHTEARQYAGRPVPDDWRCPVRFDRA